MKIYLFPIFLLLLIAIGCTSTDHSTQEESRWFKGNLHTHSYWSDGDEFPEMIMDWYKSHDYDFVALSDHNTLAEGEKWKNIPEGVLYQQAFENYVKKYGNDWVEQKTDNDTLKVRLKTLEEYRPLFEEDGKFLLIQSEEITDKFEGKPIHLNASNVQAFIAPQGGESVVEVMQNNIDAVNQQRKETGKAVMVHLNHPNFYYAITVAEMIQLQGEQFFEVYNGHPMVHNLGDSTHIGTEEMWDLINIAWLSEGKAPMYGLATDDSHHYHQQASKWSNAGRGWVMVQAAHLDAASLINAMEAGNFYASTGVSFADYSFDENVLNLTVKAEAGVKYTIEFIGCKKGETATHILQKTENTKASFQLSDDLLFVRARITSTKAHPNPIETILYEMAWTQPVTYQAGQ